jgi:glucose-specific phosphotransferase system IIA component
MGLLELLFGKVEEPPRAPTRPSSVEVDKVEGGVYAACAGTLMRMEDLPDPVFASGAMGMAVGVKPSEGVVYAPVSGYVTIVTGTLHALGLTADDGIQVLIHVGVDTVNMKGDGFCCFVKKGQHVRAGEALMTMDLDKIAEAGYSDVTITVVTNSDDYASVVQAAPGGVAAGSLVMRASC